MYNNILHYLRTGKLPEDLEKNQNDSLRRKSKNYCVVKYSEKQPQRAAKEQAWIHFVDFMDECAGITSKQMVERNALHQFFLLSTVFL